MIPVVRGELGFTGTELALGSYHPVTPGFASQLSICTTNFGVRGVLGEFVEHLFSSIRQSDRDNPSCISSAPEQGQLRLLWFLWLFCAENP